AGSRQDTAFPACYLPFTLSPPAISPRATSHVPAVPRRPCLRPLRRRRRRPLPRGGLREGGRHVVALRGGDLLRPAAHAGGDGRARAGGGGGPIRGALLHCPRACAEWGRGGARHRPLRLA